MEVKIAKKVKAVSIITSPAWVNDGYIPNWLLQELLIRLPPKAVFRFKLVSKKWHSIILEPSFVRTYCSRALSLHKSQPWTFVSDTGHVNCNDDPDFEPLVDTYSGNLKCPSYYTLSLPCFPQPDKKSNEIFEVSDGFVLYGPKVLTYGFSNYRICNPLTGQWISIPPHFNRKECYTESYMTNIQWGFMTNVKDGVLMSYTVVCLHAFKRKFITCDVFLSDVGEWKRYNVPVDVNISIVPIRSPTVLNGIMHTMIFDHGLVAYDPHKHPNRVRIISLPHRDSDHSDITYNICAAYQGKLRFFRAYCPEGDFESFNVWVLNNYSSDDWCLQHRVYFDDIQLCTALCQSDLLIIRPLSFHPYDADIVYMDIRGMTFSYNINTRKLEIPKGFEKVNGGKASFTYWHTLTIPPWPISYSRTLLGNLPNKISNHNGRLQGQIPVIDFEGIERGGNRRKEIIEEIRKASETWGFFQMINHGVPQSVMDRILEGTRKFHEQPTEAKMELYSSDSRRAVRFYCINGKFIRSDEVSWSDAFFWTFPTDIVDFKAIPSVCRDEIAEYVKYMKDLRRSLSELFSEALGLEPDLLDRKECLKSEYLTCMYYPPCPEPEKTIGTRTDSDPTCLTILVQDNTGGLQIRQNGDWIDVPPVKGALIASIGDYLQLLTNDKFKSVEYRVLPRPTGTRVSAACFFYPDCYSSQILYGPLKQLVSSRANPPLYQSVTFTDFVHTIEFQTEYYNSPDLSIFKL